MYCGGCPSALEGSCGGVYIFMVCAHMDHPLKPVCSPGSSAAEVWFGNQLTELNLGSAYISPSSNLGSDFSSGKLGTFQTNLFKIHIAMDWNNFFFSSSQFKLIM